VLRWVLRFVRLRFVGGGARDVKLCARD